MNSLKEIAKKKAEFLISVAVLLTGIHRADATATTTFAVTATVAASCTVSATALAFGSYTLTALAGTATITVTCTDNSNVKIGLSAGLATGATVTSRKMTSGSNTLAYGLYQDSGHATNWGNTAGTDTVNTTGTGAAQNITVYGLILANQTSPVGTGYTDTITVTVTSS